MSEYKDNEVVGLLSPRKNIGLFLLTTMLLIAGTGISLSVIINTYYKLSAQWSLGLLAALVIFFSITNFRVIKGSFIAAKVLKYYAVILVVIGLPALLLQSSDAALIFCFIDILILFAAIYLLSGKQYTAFVQYQWEFFADIQEAKEAVEKELGRKKH
ncbi:hypothetical protein [Thalassomonas haliotis]|uniref:Uncharacterized protein n=1 Tax=Thalassomonas haliotis TaxID=485448 RepID=A0ABY7V880_9GAMM|nr:hypothetical protein [Thalassomonas haliotis]WDE09577.1 hypothetical protein H3N35_14660 [Thalassomonas haliotis]